MELPFEILSITTTKVMGKIVLCSNIGWNAWNGPYLAHQPINCLSSHYGVIKQLLDEVEHDIMNYQNRGLCYLEGFGR